MIRRKNKSAQLDSVQAYVTYVDRCDCSTFACACNSCTCGGGLSNTGLQLDSNANSFNVGVASDNITA